VTHTGKKKKNEEVRWCRGCGRCRGRYITNKQLKKLGKYIYPQSRNPRLITQHKKSFGGSSGAETTIDQRDRRKLRKDKAIVLKRKREELRLSPSEDLETLHHKKDHQGEKSTVRKKRIP